MVYAFGDYTLNTDLYALSCAGHPVSLEPQVFAVLAYLVAHREHVVSKHELLTHVWAERFVSDKALERCIQVVRRALGDRHERPQFIQTLRGRGYRFVHAVRVLSEEPADSPLAAPMASGVPLDPEDVRPPRGPFPVDLDSEHKLVTVLVCVVSQATALEARLGPDAMFDVMRAFFRLAQSQVQRYEGTITQYRGGGFMALFGAPLAHEDHAQCAVLAALGLQRQCRPEVGALTLPPGVQFELRIGLHTGQVVVGRLDDGHGLMYTSIGDTTRWADHLQHSAAAGTVIMSEATLACLREAVQVEPWPDPGPQAHGPGRQAYRVVAYQPRRARGAPTVRRPLSAFVGRQREMEFLHAQLAQAMHGWGQVVGIVGEPGLGKSRLLYEFAHSLPPGQVTYLEGRCLSYGRTVPYLPILDLLRQHCGILEADLPETIAEKIRRALQEVAMPQEATAAYLLHLLGVQLAATPPPAEGPETIKLRTVESLCQMTLAGSRQRPLVIAIDDLHWLDPTSEECLAALIARLAGHPLFCLFTYRAGYRPPWMDKSYTTQLALSCLTPEASRQMVRTALATTPLPEPVVHTMLAKADGNPLFLEELTRAVVEQGHPHTLPTVPDTLHAVLTTRIDHLLPADKRLLQTAAVVGKEIPWTVLQALAPGPDAALQQGLQRLQDAEFLYELRLFPERVYTFKHVLTQEVAYQSLLQPTRQQYHRQIAAVLVERVPDFAAAHPEVLAHHYTEAGLAVQAIPYWQRAGQHAIARSANIEAASHLSKGLQLLQTLPATPAHRQQELDLQLALAAPLLMLQGHASPEVAAVYRRAQVLGASLRATAQCFAALVGLWRFHLIRAQLEEARHLATQCLDLAQRPPEPSLRLTADYLLGSTLCHLGELEEARQHLTQAICLYDPQGQKPQAGTLDVGVSCHCYIAWTLWLLGYPEQALQRVQEAVALARRLAHPFSLAMALTLGAYPSYYCGQAATVQTLTEEAIALSQTQGFPHYLGAAMALKGWALAAQGQGQEGLQLLHAGQRLHRSTGAEIERPHWLLMLAEVSGQAGDVAGAVAWLDEALDLVQHRGERMHAELYRQRGEWALRQPLPAVEQATRLFQRAIAVAQRQHARSLELRAVMSLSRLWHSQGRTAAAWARLTEVYNGFTEGHDTADLQQARELLHTFQAASGDVRPLPQRPVGETPGPWVALATR